MADGESDVRDYRSLGEILREAREKKGWSLEELHEHTRIAPRMVQALEADDIDQFDSPVYARGFVRQLAGPLGLDPDWLLTKLGVPQRSPDDAPAEVLPVDPPSTPATPAVPPIAPPVSERGPVWEVEAVRVRKVEVDTGGGLPWRGIVAVLVVLSLLVAGAFLVRTFARDDGEAATRASVPAGDDRPSIEPAPVEPVRVGETAGATPDAVETGRELVAERVEADPARAADAGLEWHPSTAPAEIERATAPSSARDAGVGVEETLEPVADDEPEATPAEPETPAREVIEDDETSAVTRSAPVRGRRERNEVVESEGLDRGLPSVVRGETTPAETPMRLVVTARSRVEIDITRSDGTRERRTLEAGEQWTLTGTDHFLVRASDPAAADFELDGILRDPPPRWSGREWFLHRPNDDGSR